MSKKVFELAKELDIGAIDLVEKLKTLGLNVRNHMVSLTDEEVEKALTLLKPPAPEATETKKKVVKKVVKKPATTVKTKAGEEKKVKEPKQSKEVKEAKEVEAEDKVKTSRVKVIRRKEGEREEMEKQEKLAKAEARESLQESFSTNSPSQTTQDKDKELYKEKMHTFTPVFVPEEEKKTEERSTVLGVPVERSVEEEEEEGAKKKRLGDLAAMVSKRPKRDIGEIRSTEELKTYVMGVVGKNLYTTPKKKKLYSGPMRESMKTELKESKRVITIHDVCTIEELAHKLNVKFTELRNKLLDINLLVREQDYLGLTLANEIAAIYNYKVENNAFDENEILQKETVVENLVPRSPIVTVMGHVDHGKTTLLDAIRKTKVAQGEAGGITQHIGAYSVKVKDSRITFLDTPGHAAFASMRARGAKLTDIVILVVAADDGVMPQTKESIRFCQDAKVPIIVAVNKVDKEGANVERIKQAMMEFQLTPEEWGGETQYVEISALKGQGIDKLLECIELQAEIMELKADPKAKPQGVVIESKIEAGRGPVATIIVTQGFLKKGDVIVAGECFGRARSMMNDNGENMNEVGPATPTQILGFDQPPPPGESFNVTANEREAKKLVDNRIVKRKEAESSAIQKVASLEDFFSSAKVEGEKKILKLIIRTDVAGSYEAIKSSLESLGSGEVGIQIIAGGVGPITDTDVNMAASSGGYIIGFNMRPVTSARKMAEEKGVDVKTYSIIYELINDMKLALEGMLSPEFAEKYIGRSQVKETFNIPKVGVIAGCIVVDGKIERGCNVRLLRDGKIMFDGKLSTLKRFKDEVKEVKNGLECGMALENYNDIKVDDLIEAYQMEEKKRFLAANSSQPSASM